MKQYLIIDFDSTIIQCETLDELARIALNKSKNKDEVVSQIKDITNKGMDGRLSIEESLAQRIKLLSANKSHVNQLSKELLKKISPSFIRNKSFLKKYSDKIYIVSAGFTEIIIPIALSLGLKKNQILANDFIYDKAGNIIGIDQQNLLAKSKGKVKAVKNLKLQGAPIHVIGDGITDAEVKEDGAADSFYAFTETIQRPLVIQHADNTIRSFDEYLFLNQLPTALSYPKSRMKALLLENIHPLAISHFESEGYTVEPLKEALNQDELAKRLKGVSILGVRSKSDVSKKALLAADKLLAIGTFCIGTDQTDLSYASSLGVPVFNAPFSNTRSVVEMAIGEIIILMRKIYEQSVKLHQGVWHKSAEGSFEIRGKKLGIIGYGNIGSQLSVLAENLGMEVYFFDVIDKLSLGNAKRVKNLSDLLKISDIITVHVDGRKENTNLIGKSEFSLMKKGAIFLNLSRGHIVDIPALADALKSQKLAGAAIDVYPSEPLSNKEEFISELRGINNAILTPHVGGSTAEAQANIGEYVAKKLTDYVNNGSTFLSVNFPQMQLPTLHKANRFLHVHKNVPGILAKINGTLAEAKINILGQYLKTNESIGYVITDVDREYKSNIVEQLRKIPETIKFRVLY